MTLPTGTSKRGNPRRAAGFTLIELILVMAILIVVISLVLPKLGGFFAGRALEAEANRFVALTHYAQSRAVSEGVPVMLWIDTKSGTYGLQQQPGYTDGDRKTADFRVDKDLKIDVAKVSRAARTGMGQTIAPRSKFPAIFFSPDGTVDSSASVPAISLAEGNNQVLWIVPAANRLSYEIQPQNANARR